MCVGREIRESGRVGTAGWRRAGERCGRYVQLNLSKVRVHHATAVTPAPQLPYTEPFSLTG
jgi:hypothetical protein